MPSGFTHIFISVLRLLTLVHCQSCPWQTDEPRGVLYVSVYDHVRAGCVALHAVNKKIYFAFLSSRSNIYGNMKLLFHFFFRVAVTIVISNSLLVANFTGFLFMNHIFVRKCSLLSFLFLSVEKPSTIPKLLEQSQRITWQSFNVEDQLFYRNQLLGNSIGAVTKVLNIIRFYKWTSQVTESKIEAARRCRDYVFSYLYTETSRLNLSVNSMSSVARNVPIATRHSSVRLLLIIAIEYGSSSLC